MARFLWLHLRDGELDGTRILSPAAAASMRQITVVGFDLSEAQLAAEATAMGAARYPLVQGAAEQLPFAPASFDLVFCDHGGLSWAPPHLAVPQAARVMRRGGPPGIHRHQPWFAACYDSDTDRVATRLLRDYFGLGSTTEDHGAASYQLIYGDWIKTLRGAGLVVDDLIEPRPEPGQSSSYMQTDPPDWACRWPAEMLWIAHKP